MDTSLQSFHPGYVWPNTSFPFRVYYEGEKCRIFIIVNIQHNWVWMSQWHQHFRKSDVFFVYGGWYHSPAFANKSDLIFSLLGLDKSRFFFLFNSPLEQSNFAQKGFMGDVINHNAWLDENRMKPLALQKRYRAIYVARRSAVKRHFLASKVKGLALVAGNNHGNPMMDVPPHDYLNEIPLTPKEVCEKINQARCGLILSETEGACWSSSEYLLCGIPVVSTPSTGGRDVWYNEYNSIICDPTEDAVASAVEEFVRNPRDSLRIRQSHIDLAQQHRRRFIEALRSVFLRFGVTDVDPETYFRANFYHKMRKSYCPDFGQIFGPASSENAEL